MSSVGVVADSISCPSGSLFVGSGVPSTFAPSAIVRLILSVVLALQWCVDGRSIHPANGVEVVRSTFTADVNMINSFESNEATPKLCAFRLSPDTVRSTGRITVLTRFANEFFVMRQVTMFNKLESRFRHAGYNNIQFVVVYADSGSDDQTAQQTTSNGAPPSTTVPRITPATAALASDIDSSTLVVPQPSADPVDSPMDAIERIPTVYNVTVFKENQGPDATMSSHQSPFEPFEPNAVYVFDQCGMLTYIIYAPWSSIQRPYVKASILSTIYDTPCGKCENVEPAYPTDSAPSDEPPTTPNTIPAAGDTDESTTEDSTTQTSSIDTQSAASIDPVSRIHATDPPSNASISTKRRANLVQHGDPSDLDTDDESFRIPMKIILPVKHAHLLVDANETNERSTQANATNDPSPSQEERIYLKFNFIVLRTSDPDFHDHLATDQPEQLTLLASDDVSLAISKQEELPSNGSRLERDDESVDITLINEHGNHFKPQNRSSPLDIPSDSPTVLGNNVRFTKDFVNLKALTDYEWQSLEQSKPSEPTNAELIDENHKAPADTNDLALELTDEQRASNEHYSKILQYILYVL